MEDQSDTPPKRLPVPPPGAQNLLADNPPSILTQDDINFLRKKHKIPDNIQMRLPQGEERADWMIPGWSTVYLLPFDYGFKLPVSGLLKSFCEYQQINPSQLGPATIRKILGTEKLTQMYNLKWDPIDFFQFYTFKPIVKDHGRFLFATNQNSAEIITNASFQDKNWMDKYFFVSGEWISQGSDRIPHFWNPKPVHIGKKHSFGLERQTRADRILQIRYKLRDWKELLIQINEEAEERDQGKTKSYLGGHSSTAKALQRLMAKAKAKANAEKRSDFAETSVPSNNKRPHESEPENQVISISVPDSSSLNKNPKPFLLETRKLLVPKDAKIMRTMKPKDLPDEGLELALKLFQHQVYQEQESEKQQKRLNKYMETIQELQTRNTELGSRVVESEKAASLNNKRIEELEAEVNRLKEKEQEMISLKQKKLDSANKDEQMQEVYDNACLRVKGSLMRKFLRGKINKESARRSVSDWKFYLTYLGEAIPDPDSESDEEVRNDTDSEV